jgi:hypothetical protein
MAVAVVTLVLMAVPFVWLGLWMLKGNGFSLISLPDKTKGKWDERALCRFVGGFMLYLAFCFLLIGTGLLSGWLKLVDVGVWLILGGSAVAITKMFLPGETQKRRL